jgi:hypothetical protein
MEAHTLPQFLESSLSWLLSALAAARIIVAACDEADLWCTWPAFAQAPELHSEIIAATLRLRFFAEYC